MIEQVSISHSNYRIRTGSKTGVLLTKTIRVEPVLKFIKKRQLCWNNKGKTDYLHRYRKQEE